MKVSQSGDKMIPDKPTTLVLGYFDGLHKGHIKVVSQALEKKLYTVVVTFSQVPGKEMNGEAVDCITTAVVKEALLDQMGVDEILYLDYDKVKDISPDDFIRILCNRYNVRYIYCGYNYSFGKGAAAGAAELQELCRRRKIGCIPVAPVCFGEQPISSTWIRTLIKNGQMENAQQLLGRPFFILQPVVSGKQFGRTIGIPTINQELSGKQIIPKYGVYASTTHIGDKLYKSVTNIGTKPTVGIFSPGAETYILDFSGDLYGKNVRVDFLKFLRKEEKFDNIEQLKKQMDQDVLEARSFLS